MAFQAVLPRATAWKAILRRRLRETSGSLRLTRGVPVRNGRELLRARAGNARHKAGSYLALSPSRLIALSSVAAGASPRLCPSHRSPANRKSKIENPKSLKTACEGHPPGRSPCRLRRAQPIIALCRHLRLPIARASALALLSWVQPIVRPSAVKEIGCAR